MRIKPIRIKDKTDRNIEIRSAELSDASQLLELLRTTAQETPFLVREPNEISFSIEQEEEFIRKRIDAKNEVMLVAVAGERVIALGSLHTILPYRRYAHRCSVSLAVCRDFWNIGIGHAMMEVLLDTASELGYEQAELEVIEENAAAIILYEKLGFEKKGSFPNSVKYKDGEYADSYFMVKLLNQN